MDVVSKKESAKQALKNTISNTVKSQTEGSYFCNNILHSLFSDCTVSANGLKTSNTNENYAHRSFFEPEFSHDKDAKATWLARQGYSYEENPGAIPATEVNRRKALVRQSAESTFYGKVTVEFFYLRSTCFKWRDAASFFSTTNRWFVTISNAAAKSYRIKIIEDNLYVRKMTLNYDVVYAIEKTLLSSPASYLYLETITKRFLLPLACKAGNKRMFSAGSQFDV